MARIRFNTPSWSVQLSAISARRGLRSGTVASSFPTRFLTNESHVVEEFIAQPAKAGLRGDTPEDALDFSYELADTEAVVLAIRHPSGSMTFHLPVESTRRGRGK